jgi:hypothetical protein
MAMGGAAISKGTIVLAISLTKVEKLAPAASNRLPGG